MLDLFLATNNLWLLLPSKANIIDQFLQSIQGNILAILVALY